MSQVRRGECVCYLCKIDFCDPKPIVYDVDYMNHMWSQCTRCGANFCAKCEKEHNIEVAITRGKCPSCLERQGQF